MTDIEDCWDFARHVKDREVLRLNDHDRGLVSELIR